MWGEHLRAKPANFILRSLSRVQHTEDAAPAYAREDLLAARFRRARVVPFQSAHSPFVSNLLLAIFSGFLLVFAFPEWNLWSLGWVGTAPLIMAVVRERRFWRSLLLGTMTGTIFYIGTSNWIIYSMHHYGGIPLWVCYLITLILTMGFGLFTGLFAATFAYGVKQFGGWAILSAPVLWAASEYARIAVTGVGWNALGYSQAFQPALIQTARVGGVYLVSALMVAAGTALVFAVIYLERRRGLVVLTVVIALMIAAFVYGESLRPKSDGPHSLTAVVVQPNIPITIDWSDAQFVAELLKRHLSLSAEAIQNYTTNSDAQTNVPHAAEGEAHAKVDVVIWPESPINFEYDREPELRRRLAEFARQQQVYLLISSWGYPPGQATTDKAYNSAILIAPSGEKVGQYDKVALLPFGEYVPARGWIPFMDRIPSMIGDVTPGTRVGVMDAGRARLGPMICFEATRPDLARALRAEGASLFIQLSNEAWFGPTAVARQMLAETVFRAVENNLELIRATNSGLSAKVDSFGRVSGETPMFDSLARVWTLQTVEEAASLRPTFYARHGDVFVLSCVVASLLLGLASIIHRVVEKRREKDNA